MLLEDIFLAILVVVVWGAFVLFIARVTRHSYEEYAGYLRNHYGNRVKRNFRAAYIGFLMYLYFPLMLILVFDVFDIHTPAASNQLVSAGGLIVFIAFFHYAIKADRVKAKSNVSDYHPGRVIKAWLNARCKRSDDKQWDIETLSQELGVKEEKITRVIDQKEIIDEELAQALANYTNTTKAFWFQLNDAYETFERLRGRQ